MRVGPGLPIEALAGRVAVYIQVERGLFEVLGAWAVSTPETDVRLRFAAESYKHAWHAELWQDRMPDLRDRTPSAGGVAGALLTAVAAADATIERMAGVYRVVLPRLVAAYAGHLARCSPVSDAHVVRALELARRDELDDWQAGELLLQTLLRTPDEVERAAGHVARLEALLAASGGLDAPT